MKKITDIKKNYFYYFLLIYFLVGAFLSINTGITHDEAHSNLIWNLNKSKFLNIFFDTESDISLLDTYHGYYGIGFHLVSFPIETIILKFFDFKNVNIEGSILLSKHPTVFLFFVISGLYLRKIIFLSTNHHLFSNLSAIFFLTYPYIFGHSLFNVKDIPFMSVWLVCTYFLINIFHDYLKNSKFSLKKIIVFAFLTSYLMSIRITGVLIFIEYIIFLILFLNLSKQSALKFLKKNLKSFFIFSFIFLISIYLLHPSFWSDPLKFLDSINFMSQHIQTVCTITLGECMKAQDLPSSYLFIWFFFKLPIIILIGLLLFPFVEKKIFIKNINNLIVGTLSLSIFSIIFILLLFEVNLYDELRQVLFLIPLIFIVSLIAIFFFKKKVGIICLGLFIIFFSFQNIKIYPYNYILFNNFNIFTNINKNFELDYWGVSTKQIAVALENNSKKEYGCIISNRNDGIKFFIENKNNCFISFSELHKKKERPFYVALFERSLRKGMPNNCKITKQEKINVNFSNEKLILAKIYKCS